MATTNNPASADESGCPHGWKADEWEADEWEAFQDHQLADAFEMQERWDAQDAARARRRNPRWSDARLVSEFDRLRGRYFPTLRGVWTVGQAVIGTESDTICFLAQIDFDARHITVDLCRYAHRSARQVRSTLLHELCHASAGLGHGLAFFAELERLLAARAPLSGEEFDLRVFDVPSETGRCRRWAEHRQRGARAREWAKVSWEQRRFPFLPSMTT